MEAVRSSFSITMSVWKALLVREAVARLFASRVSWVWVFAEPVLHVAYLMFLATAIQLRRIGGIDTAIWIMLGLFGYFMFRRTGDQVMKAISDNQALFAYRQVKPLDALLMRAVLEGFTMSIVGLCLVLVAELWGHPFQPSNPLAILEAFFALWLIGLGYGLVSSVLIELVREARLVLKVIMRPMYLISGVIFPLASVPPTIREILMLNPVAHGLEMARLGYAPLYHAVPELDPSYMYFSALVLVFAGLTLQYRFAARLASL